MAGVAADRAVGLLKWMAGVAADRAVQQIEQYVSWCQVLLSLSYCMLTVGIVAKNVLCTDHCFVNYALALCLHHSHVNQSLRLH